LTIPHRIFPFLIPLVSFTTNPQNGCAKSIEYHQLKAATLAREGRQVFMAAIFAFHADKAFVQVAVIKITVNDQNPRRYSRRGGRKRWKSNGLPRSGRALPVSSDSTAGPPIAGSGDRAVDNASE